MNQLRWHALLQQWVVVTTARQNRPQMPADWCPFDPGSGRVPDHYEVYLYPNDFPAFSPDADPFAPESGLFAETGPRGACDVVLYSPEHTLPPSKLSLETWRKVVDVWTERTRQHAANPDIALVAAFENCGEAVGVTMPHPHGQIYAMPFIPPVVQKELASARDYADTHNGDCLFCASARQGAERWDPSGFGERPFRGLRSICRAVSRLRFPSIPDATRERCWISTMRNGQASPAALA